MLSKDQPFFAARQKPQPGYSYLIGKAGELALDAGHVIKCMAKAKGAEPPEYHDFVATKEVEDRDGDIVLCKGCRLDNYKANPVVLWNHKADIPDYVLGTAADGSGLSVKSIGHQMHARVFYDLDREMPRAVAKMVAKGVLRGMSVGFKAHDVEPRSGYRGHVVKDWELLELSITPLPTNQEALRSELSKGYSAIVTKAFEPWLPRTKTISIPKAGAMAEQEDINKAIAADLVAGKAFPPKKKKPGEEEQPEKPPQPQGQATDEGMDEEALPNPPVDEEEEVPQPQAQQQAAQPGQPGEEQLDDGMGGAPEDLRPGVTFFTMLKDAMEASLPVQEEPMRNAIKQIEGLCGKIAKELYPGVEFGFAAGEEAEEVPGEEEEGDEEEEPEDGDLDEELDEETGPDEEEDDEEEEPDEVDDEAAPKKKKPPFKSLNLDAIEEALERLESGFVGLTGRRI